MNKAVNYLDKQGEFEIPLPGPNGTMTSEKREVGIKTELTAKLNSKGLIELSQRVGVSRIDETSAVQFEGKSVPGIFCRRIQSVNETIAGQPMLLGQDFGLFVFTTVNLTPGYGGLAPSEAHK